MMFCKEFCWNFTKTALPIRLPKILPAAKTKIFSAADEKIY